MFQRRASMCLTERCLTVRQRKNRTRLRVLRQTVAPFDGLGLGRGNRRPPPKPGPICARHAWKALSTFGSLRLIPLKNLPKPRPPAPGVALGVGIATPCCCMHCANARSADARSVGDVTGAAALVDVHAAASASTPIASTRVVNIPQGRTVDRGYPAKIGIPCE